MIKNILGIHTNYPVNDRKFDFNHQELTTLQLIAKIIDKLNETVEAFNQFNKDIAAKEDSINITNKRKLSPSGDFTGTLMKQKVVNVLASVDDSSDKIKYLSAQFADGQTGFVIDGGFFSSTGINKNFNGGIF